MVQLTNVPPARTQLRLARNQPFSLGFKLELKDGTPANLTDHVLRFIMAKAPYAGGGVVVNKVFDLDTDPTTGWARLNLQATDLDDAAGVYPFSISILTEESYSAVIVLGEVELEENTSQVPGGPYVGEGSAQTVTLTLQENNLLKLTVDTMLMPELRVGVVNNVEYWQPARAHIWGAYPLQFIDFDIPSPGNMGPTAPNLANIPPGSMLAVVWDGTNWKIGSTVITARPTDRTDITIHLFDPIGTAVLPGWALVGDLFDQIV